MGARYQFTCAECGFSAEISGGDDAGMVAETTTVVCDGCRRLFDVVTVDREDFEHPRDRPLRCPKSARHKVRPWQSGGPCPECGQPLSRGKVVCLWD